MGATRAYCKYHPLEPANWRCNHCGVTVCDTCTGRRDASGNGDAVCVLCRRSLERIAAQEQRMPLAQQLDFAFRYPLDINAGIFLLVVTVGFLLLPGGVIGYGLFIVLLGMALKYLYVCLQQIAAGHFKPPPIAEGAAGGITLLFKQVSVWMVMLGLIVLSRQHLPALLADGMYLFVVLALPASTMLLAIEEDIRAAIDPKRMLQVMLAGGRTYLVMMLMIVLIDSSFLWVADIAAAGRQSLVLDFLVILMAFYYAMVAFALMGLTLFISEDARGVRNESEAYAARSERDLLEGEIDVLVKEGRFDAALSTFRKLLKATRNDTAVQERYLRLLLALQRKEEAGKVADNLFADLIRGEQNFQLIGVLRNVLAHFQDYKPASPDLRHELAEQLDHYGDHRRAVSYLANLHKEFPRYARLPEAYRLLADILEEHLRLPDKARRFRELAGRWEQLPQG